MPELEGGTPDGEVPSEPSGTERTGPACGSAGTRTSPRVAGADLSVSVSGGPTDPEAAAVATALARHLRAEAEATVAEEGTPRHAVDPWRLAGRLGLRSPNDAPTECQSGREWKVAGRIENR